MSKKVFWYTQEVLFETNLFNKDYYWLKDVDGHIYLAPMDDNGNPDLS